MVEGIFKCYTHDIGFNDLDEFKDHIANEVHAQEGVSPCNNCGVSTEFKFTGKIAKGTHPALCKECKTALLENEP